MRASALITVAVVFWCSSAVAVEAPVSVQQTAIALLDALQGQDQATAEKLTIDFEAWKAISKRALDPDRHRARHRDFLRQLAAEFRRGIQVEQLELKDVLVLPAGIKTRREVVMAVFHLALRIPGRDAGKPVVVPLLFLQVDGSWKLSVRD